MAFVEFAQARREPAFLEAARDAGLTEQDVRDRVRSEANGTATWAKWLAATPVNNAGDLGLKVDVDLAVTNALALT